MKLSGALLGVLAGLTIHAPAATAQQPVAANWRDLLESRIRIAYRYTHPEAAGECGALEAPPTAYLVTPQHDRPVGRTWLPGPNQSKWEPLRGPSLPDTLEVNVVDLWCGASGRSVLVEAGGYYLEIMADQLATVDVVGDLSPGVLLMNGAAGARVQAALEERCAAEACRYALTNADATASGLRRLAAEREEGRQREREEAQRRADLERVGRLQTGADARTRAQAATQQRLAESLQRYGATPAQARAIMEQRAMVGMTEAMVRAALGEPVRNTTETTRDGAAAVWVYATRQVVFRGGIVTAVRQ